MACNARKFLRVTKFFLAGVTVFCVSWIACVSQWHGGVRWTSRPVGSGDSTPTMRTIVAYSESKQAELDRPTPVTCDTLPDYPQIPRINRTWVIGDSKNTLQEKWWQPITNRKVSLYTAYYDERTTQHYVRILATFHGRNFTSEEQLFCQTRPLNPYEESVEVVAAKPVEIWWHEWDTTSSNVETPLLLSCPITEPLSGPSIVSVVTQPCDHPTNAFYLERSKIKYKRKFTICVKDVNFSNDISQKLIEWIETNKILGVEIIDMYIDRITKETEKILKYYKDEGYIRLFHVPIKNKLRSLWQRRRDHMITYNDCLYRNIRESEFIIPLDIDEIVLPKIAYTWTELLERLRKRGWDPAHHSAILVQNVFFFDYLQNMIKIKHTINKNKSKIYIKRDDVRISKNNYLGLDNLNLENSYNKLNDVIDIVDIPEDIYNNYKKRCGKELPLPKLARHITRSAMVSPIGSYSKSLMLTKKVLTAFNHYPLASLGTTSFAGWPAPFAEVQLNHYKESCNTTVVGECASYSQQVSIDTAAWRLTQPLTRALAKTICTAINITYDYL